MLLVIGDSHSVIWGGKLVLSDKDHRSLFPNISIQYLGAPLAYNLIAETNGVIVPGKWGVEVLNRVKAAQGVTAVCVCFGEIDIRTRAVKTAFESGISLIESVQRIADRLVVFCDLLRRECTYPIFVAAPIPYASQGRAWSPSFPAYGSERERNWATRRFAEYLSARSRELNTFHVVSIVDQLLDCTLQTRRELYADEIHLNTRGLDLLVAEFQRIVRENVLPLADFWDPNGVIGDASSRDVSKEMSIKVDSSDQVNTVLIDIGYGALPQRLKLMDLKFENPRLEFSLRGGYIADKLTLIGNYAVMRSVEKRLDFEVEFPSNTSCRYLQIAFEASTKVSLDDIRLEVRSFLRQ